MTVTQGTDKAIINWQSFSNATHETVRFAQPAASSVALNRVVGVEPSSVQGALQANGRIFLVNPNGVVFGPNSRVDVGGLVASTLAISDQDFLGGKYRFAQTPGRPLTAVVNQGRISTPPGGQVALVAPIVNNQGQIVAPSGRVALAGATEAEVALDSAGLVSVQVPASQVRDVMMRNGDASELLQSVVNNAHVVTAGAVKVEGGQVRLVAAEGLAVNEGRIDVSAAPGGAAGQVHIQGTQAAVLGPQSVVTANGNGTSSAGGTVRALSAGVVDFQRGARIEARGGETGDGGFVELSGKKGVALNGTVDASATAGASGWLLIDPVDLEILNGSGTDVPGHIYEQNLEAQNANIGLAAENDIYIHDLADDKLNMKQSLTLYSYWGTVSMEDLADELSSQNGSIVIEALGTASGALTLGKLTAKTGITLINQSGDITAQTSSARLDALAGSALNPFGSITITHTGDVTLGTITAFEDVNLTVVGKSPGSAAPHVMLGDAAGGLISGRNVTLTVGTAGRNGAYIRNGTSGATDIAAAGNVTLSLVGSGAQIGQLLNWVRVAYGGTLATAGGTAYVSRDTDVQLGLVSAPAGTIRIHAPASINDANGASQNLVAPAAVIVAGGGIGNWLNPIEVNLDRLSATALGGPIYVTESDGITAGLVSTAEINLRAGATAAGDLALTTVSAGGGVTLTNDRGSIVNAYPGLLNVTGSWARFNTTGGSVGSPGQPIDVQLGSTGLGGNTSGGFYVRAPSGDLYVADITATNMIELTAPHGSILDANGGFGNLNAGSARLTASGSVATAADPLEVVLGAGGLGGSAGTDLTVKATSGDLWLTDITSGGIVTLNVAAGLLRNGTDGGVNVRAPAGDFTASNGVGESTKPIVTALDTLTASSTWDGVFVDDVDGLTLASIYGTGNVTLRAGMGPAPNAGDLSVGTVTSLLGTVSLVCANGSILDANGTDLNVFAGISASLEASGSVGDAIDRIDVQTLLGLRGSAGGDFNVRAEGFNLLVQDITAGGNIQLIGDQVSILDGNGGALNLTATSASVSASGSVGTQFSPLGVSLTGSLFASSGADIGIIAPAGDLRVQMAVAPAGTIWLTAAAGSILGASGAPWNILADRAVLDAAGNIGTWMDWLDTSVNRLTASAHGGHYGIFVSNAGNLFVESANAPGDDIWFWSPGDITLGDLNSGTQIGLRAQGSVLDGNGPAVNLTAPNLRFEVYDGSIGTLADAIEINTSGVVNASAGTDVALTQVWGDMRLGLVSTAHSTVVLSAPFGSILDANGDELNVSSTSARLSALWQVGTPDDPLEVHTTAGVGGAALLEFSVRAPWGDLPVTDIAAASIHLVSDAGNILDANGDAVNLAGLCASLEAPQGIIGTYGDPLDVLMLGSVSGHARDDIVLHAPVGNLPVGTLVAGDLIKLSTDAGDIVDANGSGPNVIANRATFVAQGNIGSWLDWLDTDVSRLSATANGAGSSIHIANSGALNLEWAAAPGEVWVSAGGDLTLGTALSDTLVGLLAPAGSILDGNGDAKNLQAPTAILSAGGDIGTAADPLETRIGTDTLYATAGGDIHLVEDDGLRLGAVLAGGNVDIRTLTGAILVDLVTAGGTVHLEALGAGGAIDGGLLSLVSAARGEFHASGDIDLLTHVDFLEATSGNAVYGTGSICIVNAGDFTAGTVTAGGPVSLAGGVMTLGDASGGIVSGSSVLLTALSILDGHGADDAHPFTNVAAQGLLTMVAGSIGTPDNALEVTSGLPLVLAGETHVVHAHDVQLGAVSAGAGTISIWSPGSILDANGDAVNLTGPAAALVAGGTIGTKTDPIDTDLGLETLYAHALGDIAVVERDGLHLGDVTSLLGDVSVRTRAGDIVAGHVSALGTVFFDAAGDIRPSSTGTDGVAWQVSALAGDFHAGGDLTLATHVLKLDATAGSAETRSGDLTLTNYGWLHLLGTLTAGGDVRLALERNPLESIGALIVVLGGPQGGIISGRNVTLNVGGGSQQAQPTGAGNILSALSGVTDLEGLSANASLIGCLPPFVAVLDGQLFDNWLPGQEPTTNIAARGRVDVSLGGPWWMPKFFGIPFVAPIEVTARSAHAVHVDAPGLGFVGVDFTDDVWLRTVTATAGTLSLYAPRGDVLDANGSALNIVAPTAALRVKGDIGKPTDPLEINLGYQSLYATARQGGIWLVEQDGLHIARVRAAGDVDIRTLAGDIQLGRVVAGGSIRLDAAGSILDANGDAVNLIRRDPFGLTAAALDTVASFLIAGGVIGTRSDAIEVAIDGTLTVAPRGKIACTSANLSGTITGDTIAVSGPPPGNVWWNERLIYEGCEPIGPEGRPIGPEGLPESPIVPISPVTPAAVTGAVEPIILLTLPGTVEPIILLKPPGAADPSQALKNLNPPTEDPTARKPITEEELERMRQRLIQVDTD